MPLNPYQLPVALFIEFYTLTGSSLWYPASPRRRTRGEWVSGTGDPQQSSRAQGAGAAQPRFALWSGGGRGRKRLAMLSRSEARWGCGLLPEESFTLQNAAARRLLRAIGATG